MTVEELLKIIKKEHGNVIELDPDGCFWAGGLKFQVVEYSHLKQLKAEIREIQTELEA